MSCAHPPRYRLSRRCGRAGRRALRPPAPVPLPGAEVGGGGGVGQEAPVRADGRILPVGDGKFDGQAALCGDHKELLFALLSDPLTAGEEQFAVGGPVAEEFGIRMVGHAGRDASLDRNGIEVRVAVVVAGKGDGRAVRAEFRKHHPAGRIGQRDRHTALAGDEPEFVCVDEGDLPRADGRIAKHTRVRLDACGGLGQKAARNEQRGEQKRRPNQGARTQGSHRFGLLKNQDDDEIEQGYRVSYVRGNLLVSRDPARRDPEGSSVFPFPTLSGRVVRQKSGQVQPLPRTFMKSFSRT
jgi:hypothetical protein